MNAAEIKKNLLQRFVSLITVGRRNKDKDDLEWNECWGSPFANKEDSEYSAWMVQAESLLHEVLPLKSPVRKEIKQIQKMSQRHVAFERILDAKYNGQRRHERVLHNQGYEVESTFRL